MSRQSPGASEVEDLLLSSSLEVHNYLGRALPILERAAGQLRSTDPSEPLAVMGEAVDGLAWLMEFAQVAQGLPSVATRQLEADFAGFEGALFTALSQMPQAMESGDHILLADLVEYELVPCLEQLRQTVGQLID